MRQTLRIERLPENDPRNLEREGEKKKKKNVPLTNRKKGERRERDEGGTTAIKYKPSVPLYRDYPNREISHTSSIGIVLVVERGEGKKRRKSFD